MIRTDHYLSRRPEAGEIRERVHETTTDSGDSSPAPARTAEGAAPLAGYRMDERSLLPRAARQRARGRWTTVDDYEEQLEEKPRLPDHPAGQAAAAMAPAGLELIQ